MEKKFYKLTYFSTIFGKEYVHYYPSIVELNAHYNILKLYGNKNFKAYEVTEKELIIKDKQ